MDCNCPLPTALTAIPALDCGVDLKQIQRLIFRRRGNVIGAAATPANDPLELADWQALLAAADDTKVVITPLIAANPIIDAGDAITNGGGDNTTLNGVEEVEGTNPSAFSAEFKSLTPEIERAMQSLMCELNLEVFFVLEGGNIAAKADNSVDPVVNWSGFPIQSLFVSDRNNAGFATKDIHNISFSLPTGWANDLVILNPNFNPLFEI